MAFFELLSEFSFDGDLVIEREAGEDRVEDIAFARELVLERMNEASA